MAIIDPSAALIVTELVPFATLRPVAFKANPFPVKLPAELIVPLYIDALVDANNMFPVKDPVRAVKFPVMDKSVPFHSSLSPVPPTESLAADAAVVFPCIYQ